MVEFNAYWTTEIATFFITERPGMCNSKVVEYIANYHPLPKEHFSKKLFLPY